MPACASSWGASPDSDALRQAFRRTQSRSDGTLTLAGNRWEIPNCYRHLEKALVRYATWDLTRVDLLDPITEHQLCPIYPLDKQANATGVRRTLSPSDSTGIAEPVAAADEFPPLMKKLVAEFAATGRPPSYIPKPPKTCTAQHRLRTFYGVFTGICQANDLEFVLGRKIRREHLSNLGSGETFESGKSEDAGLVMGVVPTIKALKSMLTQTGSV